MSIAVLLIFLSGELDDLASGFKKVRRASELLSEEEDEDAKELATELGRKLVVPLLHVRARVNVTLIWPKRRNR